MSSRPKLPAHGTAERYRLERTKGTTCDKCRAEMARIRKEQRANRSATTARSKLRIVDAPSDDIRDDTTPVGEPREHSRRSSTNPRRKIGEMERAVLDDIESIDKHLEVPFHRSLSVLAKQLAREIDEPATPAAARSSLSRQLFDVLRSLRTREEGDDNSAVAVALDAAGFGLPLVP